MLPIPVITFDLYDQFIAAVSKLLFVYFFGGLKRGRSVVQGILNDTGGGAAKFRLSKTL